MTLSQRFRRFFYRLRRIFAPGVDNTPLVTLEHRSFKLPPRLTWRGRVERYLRMAAGFAISIVFLGAAAFYYLESAARPELDVAPTLIVPNGGSQAIAAARYLISMQAERDAALGADRLFAPAVLLRREREVTSAAEEVAADYVATFPMNRGARAQSVIEARELVAAQNISGIVALERLNAAVARGEVRLDVSNAAFRVFAARFAEKASERSRALLDNSDSPELAFHEARGFAYAWLILLRAAAADAGELRTAPYARLSEALARASERRPNLFLRPIRGGPLAPDHVSAMALDLMLAAEAARALASD